MHTEPSSRIDTALGMNTWDCWPQEFHISTNPHLVHQSMQATVQSNIPSTMQKLLPWMEEAVLMILLLPTIQMHANTINF